MKNREDLMNIKSYVDSWELRDKKDVHPSHRTAVVEVDDIVSDLKSILENETYFDMHQAIYDLINELEED